MLGGRPREAARITASGAELSSVDPGDAGRLGSWGDVEFQHRRSTASRARLDDERHLRFMLCDLLAHLRCHADGVPDPVEGLERLERGAYDVLVTDFRMPGMTGVELVERARERDGGLRVIMLTASRTDFDPTAR
jgi:response regulator RpfG family c-di-GMP phosphodiesterase